MEIVMVAAGFDGGQADQLRRGMTAWKKSGEMERFRAAGRRGDDRQRLRTRVRREPVRADRGVRGVRLPGIARGELRPPRLCLVLAQVPRAGGVPLRAAEQPAARVLLAVRARPGRPPSRHRRAAGRRQPERRRSPARGVADGRRGTSGRARRGSFERARRDGRRSAGGASRLPSRRRTDDGGRRRPARRPRERPRSRAPAISSREAASIGPTGKRWPRRVRSRA